MDKIKPIIAVLAKHVFWAGCGVILVVSVLTWYLARDRLSDEFKTNLGTIETKVQAVGTLKQKSQQNPPNRHSHEGMDKLLDGTHQLVVKAWEKQYSYQENILRWPRELQDDFITAVRPLKPIELKVDYPTPQNQKLKVGFRMRYRNYVEYLLPSLVTKEWPNCPPLRAQWMPRRGVSGGAEGVTTDMGSQATSQESSVVLWQPQDQSRLLATHFNWSGQQDSAPTTLQVLYAQEDLWVLAALVRIIAKTNESAESRHDAVVKTIESIMIGRGATGRAGQVARVGSGQMGGGPMSGEGGDSGTMGYGAEGGDGGGYNPYGEGGGAESTAEGMESITGGDTGESDAGGDSSYGGMGMTGSATGQLTADPADGRYVDNDYVTLRATRIREAMTSSEPSDAFLVVAKRMPIRLRLIVDQRKLHRLLAECGNSHLPVEIRQVRINRGQSSSGSFGDMGGGMGGDMGGDMGGGMGGGMGGMGGESSLGGALGLGGI